MEKEDECVFCHSRTKRRRCTRCLVVYYCSTTCQREDYISHRDMCVQTEEFHKAKNRLTPEQKMLLLDNPWFMGHSYFIGSLPDHARLRISLFEKAKDRINPELRELMFQKAGYLGLSCFLGSLPDKTIYELLGQRVAVIVQILDVSALDTRLISRVRDVSNVEAHIIFCIKDPLQVLNILLLLHVAQFILLLNVPLRCSSCLSKVNDIVVIHMNQVSFIT